MFGDEFLGVLAVDTVNAFIACVVKQEVVAHTRADKAFLDARKGIDCMVDVEELGVVGVEVGAYLGMDARRTFTLVAKVEVLTVHGIHIGRRSTQVAEIAFEVGQLGDGPDFAKDALLAARGDELTLMGRDGTESATAETTSMETDGEFDHLVSRDTFAFVFGVGQTGVGKVEGSIKFVLCEGLVGRIDDDVSV